MTFKRKVGVGLNQALEKFGYKVQKTGDRLNAPNSKDTLLNNFFKLLVTSNFEPVHILDVGANRGTWTRTALKYFPDANFSLLEPQYWLKEYFTDLIGPNNKIKYYPVGAGKVKGTFKFTLVDRDDSCSFKFSEKEALDKGLKQMDLPVTTLNDLIIENNLSIPDMVKIDAEGWDLEVLQGATSFLGKTEIFLLEAGIMNTKIQNDALSVISYMDKNGYRLFDVTDLNRPFSPRVLWLVELAFIKKGGLLDKNNI